MLQNYEANPHQRIHKATTWGIVVIEKYQELYKDLTVCVAPVVLTSAYKWKYFEVAVDNFK